MVPYGETTSQGYHARYWNSNLLENSSKPSNAGISRKNDAVTDNVQKDRPMLIYHPKYLTMSRGHREHLHTLQARLSFSPTRENLIDEKRDITQYSTVYYYQQTKYNHFFYRTINVDKFA